MIERLTPGEYQKREISDLPPPEAWLNKQLVNKKKGWKENKNDYFN